MFFYCLSSIILILYLHFSCSNNLEIQLNYLVVSCFKGVAPAYDTGGVTKRPHCRNVCIPLASVQQTEVDLKNDEFEAQGMKKRAETTDADRA